MKPSKPIDRSQRGSLSLLTAALASLGLVTSAHAQLQTAGTLFVNIDATALPEGALNSITNSGTLGGVFDAVGGGDTVPEIATFNGTPGIRFDGTDYMKLTTAPGSGTIIPAPAGITGINPTRSIEVWAMNPSVDPEEAMVTWGHRGGPDSANMSFNYGNDPQWGALAQWGARDMGWVNNSLIDWGTPVPKRWHYLVYTYDGATNRVYTDGALSNFEPPINGDINTAPDTSINLAAQLEADGTTPSIFGSLTLARVRIHDGTLSDAQILNNYNFEKNSFTNSLVAETLVAPPANRYSFSEPATDEAVDLPFVDSIGGQDGVVRGVHGKFSGTRLILPGGPSTTEAYGDLPNGLVSSRSVNNGGSGELTIEGWVRQTSSLNWARIFDFGSSANGGGEPNVEIPGPGYAPGFVATGGADFLFYSAQIGASTVSHRVEVTDNDPPGGGSSGNNVYSPTFNTDLHYVVTWNESTGDVRVYENGVEVNSFTTTKQMSEINDINVWLGRSNFTFDNNTAAEYDELRIYNRVLSPGEIFGNYQAGPNTLNTGAAPVTFVTEPVSSTVYETYQARFTAATAGSPPISYQWLRDGSPIPGATGQDYTLSVTPADNGAKFSVVVSNFTGTPNVLTSSNAVLTVVTQAVTLQHRYSFSEANGDATVADSIGGANGDLINGGSAAFNGSGQLVLDGANSYVNLPNDLVINLSNITVEAWITDNGSGVWSRIFDFGNSTGGEDFPILPGPAGTQHFYLAQPSASGPVRGTISTDSNPGDQLIPGSVIPTNQMTHVAWTINGPAHTSRIFVNGVQVGENTGVTLVPANLGPTQNDWLGRSQYGSDPFFNGVYDEFRIWDGAMTPAQAAASFLSGPNFAPVVSLQVALSAPNQITVSYPASPSGFTLQKTAEILSSGTSWQTVTEPATTNGNVVQVTLPVGAGNQFFRLQQPE